MSRRAASWLAWPLAEASVAMFVASVALYVLARSAQEALGSWDALGDLLVFVALCPEGSLWVDVDAFEEGATTARRTREPGA